tara:strand:+ start:228 stop:605 length:378 start_codon:yes stop_codon:yes gene_type:complete
MTIKLMLLKSGEDVIADITEMRVGTDDESQVIGYQLDRPCVVKMRDPNLIKEDGPQKKSGFSVSLFPWMPLTKQEKIPVPADWMITMVEPIDKLKEMYIEDIVEYGKDDKGDSTDDDSASSDKSD